MSSAQHLAKFLGDERKIYGVESPIDDEINQWRANAKAPITMEDLAGRYVEIIKSLEPRGPYHLAGYCFGGVLAFEVARQLQQQGERVGALVFLDAIYGPGCKPLFLGGLRRWFYHAVQLPKKGPAYLAARLRNQLAKTRTRLSRAVTSRALLLARRDESVERMRRQYSQSLTNILASYKAGRYEGDALLFRTVAEPNSWEIDVGAANGWDTVIQGSIERNDIHYTHKELFEEKAFIDIAVGMRRYLEKIDKKNPDLLVPEDRNL
jgi:nonribosomal peptide synthetase DhbF